MSVSDGQGRATAKLPIGPVVRASAIAGLVAGILCAFLWIIGSVFGTNFEVQPFGSDQLMKVTLISVILFPVVVAVIAALIAGLLFRGPGAFLWVLLFGFALTLISLAIPLLQPSDVTWPTRLWLSAMHLLTGLIVVPVVAAAVGGRALAGWSPGGPERAVIIQGEAIEISREEPPRSA